MFQVTFISISFLIIVVNYDENNKKTYIWDKLKSDIPVITNDFRNFASTCKAVTPDKLSNGWVAYANSINNTDAELHRFLVGVDEGRYKIDDIDKYMQKAGKSTSKFGLALKNVAANVGISILVSLAMKGISLLINKINDYINRLDIAKDKLSETTSELKSVESEIDSVSSKIKDLESSGPLSLTDKEELKRLKEENAELEKRQQYLEKQKKAESEKVVQYAKEKMDYNYGRETSREDIDAYKKYMDNPEAYDGTYYEDDALTIKIAQYEKYKEQRKQAVENEDWEAIELIDKNLQQLEESLIADRTELQGFRDDLSLTGESSAELDNVNQKLKFIDNTLLSPGQNLVKFIDNDITDESKDKLVKLAEEGKLTSDVLKKNFSEVDTYLTKNGLTLEDLISILVKYKKELSSISDIPLSFSEQMTDVHSLSEGLDQLDSIMADVINGEEFDYSSILNNDSFNDAFKKYGKEYEDFIQAVTESPKDISKCQQAFDNLATAYVNGSEALKDLTEETREAAILELGQMGIKNAKEVVDSYLQIDRAKKEIENSGYDLANISYEEAYAFMQLSNASDTARNYLFAYYAQKLLINKNGINTVQDCIQLKNLANAAGYTGSALLYLAKIQSLLNKIDNENLVEGTLSYQAAYSKLTEYNNGLQKLLASEMKVADVQVDFGNGTKSLAAAQEKAADATDKVTDALEKEKSKLEDIKAEYDLLYDAVMWFYDKQIEKIDDKIDALNEENERLQEQQENMDRILAAIESNYDAEIKLIQDKIDALKDENDEEERALALEEAKRKLQEAKSRKTLMVYQKGVGFTYQVDTKAITEAEEELEELQENEVVAELEKQIEKLEEAKNKWSEIPEAYEKAMQEIAAMNYFGKNWKEITLNPSDGLLNSFEGKYTGIQSSIDKNEDRIESYEKEKEKIEELKKAWEDAKNAYQYYQYETKLAEYFGSDYEYQLLNNSKVWRQQYAEEYSNLCSQIEALEQKIKAANDETANAATTNAETIKTANEETVKSAEALSNSVSQAETATGSVIDAAGEKVDNIAKVINTLKDAIFNLITNINILYQTMTEIDSISLGNLMAQFGAGSSNGSFEGGMVVTGVMTKPSEGGEESASGGSGLLGAINAVIDAVGKIDSADTTSLIGALNELNNTELKGIIDKFGISGDNGATEGSLLSAINNVSNTITGEGNVESGLIPSIKELGSDATSGHIFKVQNSFHTLMQEITGVIKQVDALIDKINSIPKVPSIGGNSKGTGTAFTFGTGTAFSGTAYASGTGKWGLPSDKPGSLVAEQGSEIVVRDGKYRLISSPTLMDLKKGDIVFNHKQTEAIMKNGSKPVIDKIANKNEKIVNDLKGFAFAEGTIKEKIFEAIMNGISLIMNPKDVIPKFAQNIKKLPDNPSEQKVEIHIGDIHVHGVDNVNDFADDILKYLPNALLQKINKK